jgi:23S rRNA pseudouridine2605 synthase
VRLQKVLAAAGFGSRRQCEELIVEGRVEIDRKIVTELGTRVDPLQQEVRVDGEVLARPRPVYFAVYKPKGYICSHYDPRGRPLAVDLIPPKFGRLFTVGRLDMNSEGLILVTNDGALAERLTHPRYEVPKKYLVQVAGQLDQEILRELKKGIYLAEGVARVAEARIRGHFKNSTIVEMTLTEGKNREIRRILARMDHKVMKLQRIAVDKVKLGKLLPGDYRPLTGREIDRLYAAAEISHQE